MKRILLVSLALTALLWGCAFTDMPETTAGSTAVAETTEPQPTSLYLPGDAVEQQTQGAVKTYALERTGAHMLEMLGEKLIVFLDAGGTELMAVDPANGTLLKSVTLNCKLQLGSQMVQVGSNGIGYYNVDDRTVVILDGELREITRVSMPDNMLGEPVIAPSLDQAYYCTANEIRVLEIKTGISRLLRQQENEWQTLSGLYFDGTVLVYPKATDGRQVYINTTTGALIDTVASIQWMRTDGDSYILERLDEPVQIKELLFGKRGQQVQKLNYRAGQAEPLILRNGVVTVDIADGLLLEYYDLVTGSRTAQVRLGQEKRVIDIAAADQDIWILCFDNATQSNVLYRWDINASAVVDDAVYAGTWFTAENPDTEGLVACQTEADAIADKYGVDIRIAGHALDAPCDYEMEAEFHVNIFREKLRTVDEALSKFPEDFWKQVGKVSSSGKLHICLVRSVADDVTGIQFWHDGDAYAAVQLNGDLEYNLYLELYQILDTYVFNNTSALDTWGWLNPKKFSYFESYSYGPEQVNQDWLTGEKRAFVDAFGMTYPREDRAQFFASAMTEGNEAVFEGETMQSKLRSLGKAIREAFKWKKDERSFPWEQYLNEPLAYTKKK